MYLIGRACTTSPGCSCKEDKCAGAKSTPHQEESDPLYSTTIPASAPAFKYDQGVGREIGVRRKPDFLQYGAHVFEFELPAGVACDHCTVQWHWATGFGEWFR